MWLHSLVKQEKKIPSPTEKLKLSAESEISALYLSMWNQEDAVYQRLDFNQ